MDGWMLSGNFQRLWLWEWGWGDPSRSNLLQTSTMCFDIWDSWDSASYQIAADEVSVSSVKRYNVTLSTHDGENRHLLLRHGAWCVCSSCDKRSRWSEVMYQLQLRLCVATGLAWEGRRGGCLVTTNLLKCLTNMRGRALFWQWIVKSAFYSVFS